jgi:hypothetical protein
VRDGRSKNLDDGKATPELPARLEDGATVVMTWMREELGEEHFKGEAEIKGSFALDPRGTEVRGAAPT